MTATACLEIMTRARELADRAYDEIPIHCLIRGLTSAEIDGARAALRALRRAGMLRAGSAPGYLIIAPDAR